MAKRIYTQIIIDTANSTTANSTTLSKYNESNLYFCKKPPYREPLSEIDWMDNDYIYFTPFLI